VKRTFCTISTASHLYKCFALADSLAAYGGELHVLLVDQNEVKITYPSNIKFNYLSALSSELAQKIIKKYRNQSDRLRWSLKSCYLLLLLEIENKVIYVDNDIFFFDDFGFLFNDLDNYSILLTPHHYPRNPEKNQNWFEANFRVGLYNAGFIGANKQAKAALEWWAKACLYRCEKNYWRGLFDDQKYLDLMPLVERNSKVLDHLGCNVAEWNKEECRQGEENGKMFINEIFPLIFYHFNAYSRQNLKKDSTILKKYFESLKTYNSSLSLESLIPKESKFESFKLFCWKLLNSWNG
jgi:hypothetical protein